MKYKLREFQKLKISGFQTLSRFEISRKSFVDKEVTADWFGNSTQSCRLSIQNGVRI